jgi:hypothetical protein
MVPHIPLDEPGALRRARVASGLLDDAFELPVIGVRVGIDPLLSVLPGGTVVGTLLSLYVVLEAARYGVPRALLGRMLLNVAVDGLGGAVPLVGPVLDLVFRANDRNVRLFERHLLEERREAAFVGIEIE